jgi:hypothetical protein
VLPWAKCSWAFSPTCLWTSRWQLPKYSPVFADLTHYNAILRYFVLIL